MKKVENHCAGDSTATKTNAESRYNYLLLRLCVDGSCQVVPEHDSLPCSLAGRSHAAFSFLFFALQLFHQDGRSARFELVLFSLVFRDEFLVPPSESSKAANQSRAQHTQAMHLDPSTLQDNLTERNSQGR